MKTIILVIAAALVGSGALKAQAQDMSGTSNTNAINYDNYNRERWNSDPGGLYRANELSLEAFGSLAGNGHHDDFSHDGFHHHDLRGGGGGGLEYFFNRYVGVEGEVFANGNDHSTDTSLGGNLVVRFPIMPLGLAPYVFGGGGNEWRQYPHDEGYGDAGAGLEYRFNPQMGVFADGRGVIPASTRNYGMGRLGFRFAF